MSGTKSIHVLYQGKRVGEVRDFGNRVGFQYADSFLDSGHQLSPIELPLNKDVFEGREEQFRLLPGIFADSLPDKYGRRIMYDWFAKKRGEKYSVTAADMLAYVGHNGMGALVYEPVAEEYDATLLKELDLTRAERETRSIEGESEQVIESLRAAAKTVGGSFPKALIALDPATGKTYEERRGLPIDFEHWIVKFGVGQERLKNDFRNYPEVEMAYLDMARDCGISVPEIRSFETTDKDGKKLVHLGVRRFDLEHGQRLHYASLAGLKGWPADEPLWRYKHLTDITKTVVRDFRAIKEQCLRMMFNVASANLDDHAKNHGFLYDGKEWRISPAFDLSFWGFQPNAEQAMAVGTQVKQISFEVIKEFCEKAKVSKSEIDEMGHRVRSVLEKASTYFEKRNLSPGHSEYITDDLKKRMAMSLTIPASIPSKSKKSDLPASLESPITEEERRKHTAHPDVPELPKDKEPPLSHPPDYSGEIGDPEKE